MVSLLLIPCKYCSIEVLNTSCFKFVLACMPVKLENGSLKGLTLEIESLPFTSLQILNIYFPLEFTTY